MAFWAQRARKVGKQAQERYSCSTCFSAQASNTRAGCCPKQLHKGAGDAGKMTCRSSLSTQLPYRIETWNQECCRNSFDQITVTSRSKSGHKLQRTWEKGPCVCTGRKPWCLCICFAVGMFDPISPTHLLSVAHHCVYAVSL